MYIVELSVSSCPKEPHWTIIDYKKESAVKKIRSIVSDYQDSYVANAERLLFDKIKKGYSDDVVARFAKYLSDVRENVRVLSIRYYSTGCAVLNANEIAEDKQYQLPVSHFNDDQLLALLESIRIGEET